MYHTFCVPRILNANMRNSCNPATVYASSWSGFFSYFILFVCQLWLAIVLSSHCYSTSFRIASFSVAHFDPFSGSRSRFCVWWLFSSRIFAFQNLHIISEYIEVFEMPIDWKKPDAAFRLLAAVYGALGEEPVRYRTQGTFLPFSRTASGNSHTVPSKSKGKSRTDGNSSRVNF
jgi:hypothetical protein